MHLVHPQAIIQWIIALCVAEVFEVNWSLLLWFEPNLPEEDFAGKQWVNNEFSVDTVCGTLGA